MEVTFSRAGRVIPRAEAASLVVSGCRITVAPADGHGTIQYAVSAEVRIGPDQHAWVAPSRDTMFDAKTAAALARSIALAAELAAEVDLLLAAADA